MNASFDRTASPSPDTPTIIPETLGDIHYKIYALCGENFGWRGQPQIVGYLLERIRCLAEQVCRAGSHADADVLGAATMILERVQLIRADEGAANTLDPLDACVYLDQAADQILDGV